MEDQKAPDWILIDAMNFAYRSWWNVRGCETTEGVPTGLEYGYLKNLLGLQRVWQPARIVLVWDGEPVHGTRIDPQYKAGRSPPPFSYERVGVLREKLTHLVWSAHHPEIEADQIAGWVARKLSGTRWLLSNDDDWLQWCDDKEGIFVLKPGTKKSPDRLIDEVGCKEIFGVFPERLALLRTFAGDKSDKLPGVARVGLDKKVTVVTPVDLSLPYFEQIDAVIANAQYLTGKSPQKFKDFREQALRNYRIMDLRGSTPVKFEFTSPTGKVDEAKQWCSSLEMVSLLKRKEWELFLQE